MSNVIDIEPLRDIARRASAKIGDPKLAERFVTIAVDKLVRDPRALRKATSADLTNAPEWTKAALARGDDLYVYRPNAALAARLNVVARRISETRRLAEMDRTANPDVAALILEANIILKKFDRLNFDTAAEKVLAISNAFDGWRTDNDTRPVCEPQSLVLLSGHIWHRITSVAELRRVGAEFRNCLGRSTGKGGYGAYLRRGTAQFWVLRDLGDNGLIVAMAPSPRPTNFTEVKGPSNARIYNDHPAVVQLGIAIGVRPPPPQPPRPPRPNAPRLSPASLILPAVLETRRPCHCTLCDPQLRLRRSMAAP